MSNVTIGPLQLHLAIERWPLVSPFTITGYRWEFTEILLVTLEHDGFTGRGEATGVYYRNDTPASMNEQIEALRPTIESGLSRDSLQALLPCGGARNALDCALCDLEAKVSGRPVWQIAQLEPPRPLLTTFTCGADQPDRMAATALRYKDARAIKLKLLGDECDAQRVLAVRSALPDVWLGVDANQGFSVEFLRRLMPVLVESRVELIEQPFPVGQEHFMDQVPSPIRFAADESVQGCADIRALVGRFSVVNIKLDKCGGLTEGLAMAHMARSLGLRPMVGNMTGTSLGMAPASVIGQLCEVVDLDGPVFLKSDRINPVDYVDGRISCPSKLWGYPDG